SAATRRGRARGRASRSERCSRERRLPRVDLQTRADDLDESALGAPHVVVAVAKLSEDPARQDRLQRAVEDEAREPRVELAAELAGVLPALDDTGDRVEHLPQRVDPALELGAPADLA